MRATTVPIPERTQRTVAALLFTLLVVLFTVLVFAAASFLFSMSASAQATASVVRVQMKGQKLDICNIAGTVSIVPSDAAEPEVIVTRRGRDAARLKVEPAPGETSTLHIIYPESHVIYPPMKSGGRSTLQVGSDGCLHGKNTSGRHNVTISRSGKGLEAWADLEVRLPRGRQVALGLGVGAMSAAGVEADLKLDVGAAEVKAERIKGALTVDTGSGPVVVSQVEGALLVDTGSGSVECHDVKGPRVSLDTGSGGVSGSGIRADELLVDTGSGGVDLAGVQATDIRVDTGSGGVRLGLVTGPATLNVDTGSGGVTIEGPADLSARLSLETGSGSITSDFPITVVHRERDALEGSIGSGTGHIHVDTGSGGIRLVKR